MAVAADLHRDFLPPVHRGLAAGTTSGGRRGVLSRLPSHILRYSFVRVLYNKKLYFARGGRAKTIKGYTYMECPKGMDVIDFYGTIF